MNLDFVKSRRYLKESDFKSLFIEELGWDHYDKELNISIDGKTFTLSAIAEKRGMAAFVCTVAEDGKIPDYATRRKIEKQTAKSVHEHIIIYTDDDKTTQIWQWVKRESGRPDACREHTYHTSQPGDSLLQKLQNIAFSIEEEENLTIAQVAGRARAAFDVERVTKRFYDRFKKEHDAFLKFIDCIPDEELQKWYASVMLNRLMFIYFIQKKGFLDNDLNYLRNKLAQIKQTGRDRFYRDFLCPLFFEGFAKKAAARSPKVNKLLGRVPYLNGGLFLKHQIEELHGRDIQISDKAFEKLFSFFEDYDWHLDERPRRADNEINPDVLGYIFEKYINQKQMGAYYTKEDITEYISKNTIIPFLFDTARKKCKIAFEGEQSIWKLLQEDPDKYIYDAVKSGVIDREGNVIPESALPDFVQKGMHDPKARMFDRRYNLTEADLRDKDGKKLTLPTETWREYVERRKRCLEIREKLQNGEIRSINDFITYNLNIRQFAQDVIWNSEGPELLRAFYHAIEKVTVLDPTCGSGAFLFAALNILEPLYEACLERMQVFIDELEQSGKKHRKDKYGDFRKILEKVSQHPNLKYFIYKSIIVNNLYGVDIMEEAIEICKLRLFLKLVAQIDNVSQIEPLPDIDFNIRAGNTLVGYATYDEVKQAVTSKLDFDNTMQRIEEQAEDIDRLFKRFHEQQTELGGEVTPEDKLELRNKLRVLEDELNQYLAGEYGIDPNKKTAYEKWLKSHQPFHWFVEFYGILKKGGFDVIIGNPPYVEYSKVKKEYTIKGYQTESCGNLYAYVMELSLDLLHNKARFGMIVQLPIVCTDRMKPLQQQFYKNNEIVWFSSFDDRPARLFDGLEHIRATIVISQKGTAQSNFVFSTNYNRWYSECRSSLFNLLTLTKISNQLMNGAIPKIGQRIPESIMQSINRHTKLGSYLMKQTKNIVYFHNAPQYWIRAMNFAPYFWNERDGEQISTQVKSLFLLSQYDASVVVATLNSSLFYWWFIILSDCRHLNLREIENFPISLDNMSKDIKEQLKELTELLMNDYKGNAYRKECFYKTTGKVIYDEFYPKKSKSIIDKIDCVLAKHYGFTDEELDFIINYDIKYRMGIDN
jgi:hypothetical protein